MGDPLQPGSWIIISEPEVYVGLGWDFTGRETFDLDASVTGFDINNEVKKLPKYSLEEEIKLELLIIKMLENGIYVAPSQFEAMFVSDAHSQDDLDKTIQAIKNSI